MYNRRKRRRQNGSALMLTVGLLAILVMLGTTFLLVSHLDAKNSEAVVTRNQSMQVAGGAVTRLAEMLKADLHMGDKGPFSAPGLSGETLAAMAAIDVAREETKDSWWTETARPDQYLTHTDDSKDIFSLLYPLAGDSKEPIDINASGRDNAWLRDGQAISSTGQRYWVAARVIDLSGRACVNTAGRGGSLVVPRAPVLYDLEGMIGSSMYTSVARDRTGTDGFATPPSLQQYFVRGASRLLKPSDGDYQPFSVSDEMSLRYYEDDAIVDIGRLHEDIAGLSEANRALLTTFSCSRRLMRWPQVEGDEPVLLDMSTSAKRNKVYEQIWRVLAATKYGKDDAQRKRIAASFTANLWAYSSDAEADFPWKYSRGGVTAWGLRQRLVITEAYACHKNESAIGAQDHVAGFAVELFNPTGMGIALRDYKIKVGSEEWNLPNKIINPGNKVVLYNYVEGPSYTGGVPAKSTDTGLDTNPKPAHWFEVPDAKIRFDKDEPLQLFYRDEVIVDQVSGDDLDYAGTDIQTDPSITSDIRRDDRIAQARYNLAVYKSSDVDRDHDLGTSNGLNDSDFKDDNLNSTPILSVNSLGHSSMHSLAELGHVYLTGPQKEGSDLTPFSKMVLRETGDAVDFQDVPGRARPNFYPGEIDVDPDAYPRVPLGCLLGEFFTMHEGDPTRDDDSRRAYGLININTAPEDVLKNLPWPKTVGFAGDTVIVSAADIAKEIVKYRSNERSEMTGYANNLRDGQDYEGFLTPGEIAVPLAHYMCKKMGWDPATSPSSNVILRRLVQHPDFIKARDALYNAVADLITVRSDTFAIVVHVQVGEDVPAKQEWKYLAIVDRSNCNDPDDQPAVLLFTPLK